MVQITANGHDNLAPFVVIVPGECGPCGEGTEVVLKYDSMKVSKALRALGVDPTSPSVILDRKKAIGVSCGCYARFHRQVAHISDKRKTRKSS